MRVVFLGLLAACGRLDFDEVGDGGVAFTVNVTVVGEGAVVSTPTSISCGGECTATFDAPVTLTAFPAAALTIDWQGIACTGATCVVASDADILVTFGGPTADVNRAFVTAATYQGDIQLAGFPDGLAAADAICQQTASSAGLDGTFVAFLSSTTTGRNAIDALAGSSGWADVNGRPIYVSVGDITSYHQLGWLDHDERGVPVLGTEWLGGAQDGLAAVGTDCGAFTSVAVANGFTGTTFELANPATAMTPCTAEANLPCFEIGKTYTYRSFPYGRAIFISSTLVAATIGVAGADAQCQTDADAGGLIGTFRALLATSTTSISDHMGGLAGPWLRPDGAVVTFGDLDLITNAAVATLADGSVVTDMRQTWVGAMTLTDPATSTCGDWTSTTGMSAVAGLAGVEFNTWLYAGTTSCSMMNALICGKV